LENHGFKLGEKFARQLDAEDELSSFREEFVINNDQLIYMDGNSLGRLPRRTILRLQEIVKKEWGEDLIRGWNAGWFQAPARLGEKIAQMIGAVPGQVVLSDSTSINLFKLIMAALSLYPRRRTIISDRLNFPSDLYILQGCINLLNEKKDSGDKYSLNLIPSENEIDIDIDDLSKAIDQHTALVTLSHVTFKSGFLYDVDTITQKAHNAGALVLWDLSHSVGVVPIELDDWGVDMAVGCTYKYLNGGPGSPAFLYVRRDLQEQVLSPIWGWFGQRSPFAFDLQYRPAQGISRFLAGTPQVLSLLAMEAGLDLQIQADIDRIRGKSIHLTSYLVYLFDEILAPLGFTLGSPRDPSRRGSHISLRHPEGYRINRALIEEMDVLPDFREPDHIRLGLAPLYTRFLDVWQAVDRLRRVVEEGRFHNYAEERLPVT
jgi:kynureninase